MLLTNNAEGGTNGTQLTTGNSGFDIVNNGTTGSSTFTSSNPIKGSLSYRTVAGTNNTYLGWSTSLNGAKTELWTRIYGRIDSFYDGAWCILRSAGSLASKSGVSATGKFNIQNAQNTYLQTSNTAITTGAPFRVEMHATASSGVGNSDGTIEVRIYTNPDSTTPTEVMGPFTTQTAPNFDQVWFGPVGGGSTNGVLQYDEVIANNTGWAGPLDEPSTNLAGWGMVSPLVTSTPPDPPAPSGMLLGVNNLYFDALQTKLHSVNANATMQVRRWYMSGSSNIPSSWASTPGQDDVGRTSWGSANGPSVSVINSGSYDATLDSFFASIPATQQVIFTWKHEVNNKNDEKLEGSTRAQFRAAVSRIHARKEASSQNPSNIAVGVILTAEPFRNGEAADYFPTDGGVDYVGADPYRFWRPPGSPDDPKCNSLCTSRTMQYLLGDGQEHGNGAPQLAERLGIPLALGEYGAHPFPDDTSNRPNWLNETDTYLRSLSCGVMAACYFHSHNGESGPWFIDRFHTFATPDNNPDRLNGANDPSSLSAYASIIAAANQ